MYRCVYLICGISMCFMPLFKQYSDKSNKYKFVHNLIYIFLGLTGIRLAFSIHYNTIYHIWDIIALCCAIYIFKTRTHKS